ncbi:myb-like protein X isoform X1 [Mytilus edulis]|uniref:myb-like protein X isoform X1 n=2 Tax=Mytilus edulis TaxID=6550 RepID=UPI0039EFA8C0
MNELRLSGLFRDRYKTKFYGLVQKYCYPALGYSATPCSYPNNLSSHPIRDCSMHSPLRVKIQNALNKAFQLEKTDVLFVGGRRQNRKRRKHAKDKKKSKKYEGKGTPVLKAKTYNGNKGKYAALVADDDISLSPSMVDELFYGTKTGTISINCDEDEVSVDAISVNQADANNKEDDEESVYDDNDEETIDVPELSYTETSLQEEMKLAEIKHDEERHSSCDTGYNSEEDHRIRTTSESEDEIQLNDNDNQLDCGSNLDKQGNNTEDDVFVDEKEEGFNESFVSEEDDITHQESNLNEKKVSEKTEVDNTELNDDHTELTDKEVTDSRVEQNLKDDLQKCGLSEKNNVPDITLKKPRIIANFDYDEEEEEEIYTKQPKTWFRKKTEEDEELRPLICCGDENGVGFACCTIL